MKQLRNEEGYVIIVAVLVLALLSIIGITAVNTSNLESRIVVNMEIHYMNFYAAESGLAVAPLGVWYDIKDMPQDDVKVLDNVSWPYGDPASLPNQCIYDWRANPEVDTDGNVILYGDTNDDYMFEENIDVGVPRYYTMVGHGTHPRGGYVEVKGTFEFSPGFFLPQAALFGHAMIEKSGGSGSIEGADHSPLGCPNISDIATDGDAATIDIKDMVLDDDGLIDVKTNQNVYPVPLLRDVILGMVHDTMGPTIDVDGTYEGVIFATPDADGNVDAQQLTGRGILFVDGNLDVNGGIGWEGMIIVNGEIRVNGGGGLVVEGAIAAWGDITLNGSVAIKKFYRDFFFLTCTNAKYSKANHMAGIDTGIGNVTEA